MGTNYYVRYQPCPHCGRSDDRRHIGKSSAGWTFGLRVYPNEDITDIADWVEEWSKPGAVIVDEYGRTLTPEEMVKVINREGWQSTRETLSAEWYAMNDAEPGPNGLARRNIDGWHCIGHAPGGWDYIIGDLS